MRGDYEQITIRLECNNFILKNLINENYETALSYAQTSLSQNKILLEDFVKFFPSQNSVIDNIYSIHAEAKVIPSVDVGRELGKVHHALGFILAVIILLVFLMGFNPNGLSNPKSISPAPPTLILTQPSNEKSVDPDEQPELPKTSSSLQNINSSAEKPLVFKIESPKTAPPSNNY